MKKETGTRFRIAAGMLALFLLWTAALRLIDVQAIGPQGSAVGFASINRCFHELTGVHMLLYRITDLLSLVPLGIVTGFAMLGLRQWIERKSLRKVDFSLLVLGGFYIVVMTVYTFFEIVTVNYRPVLIDGVLEGSYPSSTTMLVLCVMPTAILQLRARIQSPVFKRRLTFAMTAFTAFMVIGRLLSGVHWLTDIIGGILLSAGLVMMYHAICRSAAK